MEYVVRTHGLTKKVKGSALVSDIQMNIKRGEIYGFLGPNGAGKTTVMKMLLTLTAPTSGEIELFGRKLTEQSRSLLHRVGSIIEHPIFYEHLSARENMKLHCEFMGAYDDKAIREACDLVNLSDIDRKPVKDFSLGMKQRLGIARAIVTKPELIILDEPTNGLDPLGIKEIRQLFRMLNKEYGTTILISSHILGEVEQIADTIGVIKNGRLLNEIAISEVRKLQSDYIELIVNQVNKAVYLLENELNISNFKIVGEDRLRIYEPDVSQSEISKMLFLNQIEVSGIFRHTASLEDYFFNQIHGGDEIA